MAGSGGYGFVRRSKRGEGGHAGLPAGGNSGVNPAGPGPALPPVAEEAGEGRSLSDGDATAQSRSPRIRAPRHPWTLDSAHSGVGASDTEFVLTHVDTAAGHASGASGLFATPSPRPRPPHDPSATAAIAAAVAEAAVAHALANAPRPSATQPAVSADAVVSTPSAVVVSVGDAKGAGGSGVDGVDGVDGVAGVVANAGPSIKSLERGRGLAEGLGVTGTGTGKAPTGGAPSAPAGAVVFGADGRTSSTTSSIRSGSPAALLGARGGNLSEEIVLPERLDGSATDPLHGPSGMRELWAAVRGPATGLGVGVDRTDVGRGADSDEDGGSGSDEDGGGDGGGAASSRLRATELSRLLEEWDELHNAPICIRFVTREGSYVWFEVTANPTSMGLVCVYRDITDRKARESLEQRVLQQERAAVLRKVSA